MTDRRQASPPIERRDSRFREVLSMFMVRVSALGALLVLLDLRVNFVIAGQAIQIGGSGFSDQLKGAVIALILVSGYSAVKEYWLGSSEGGQIQNAALSRIAEQSAPAAAAVAAAGAAPIKTDAVHVDANTATVNEVPQPQKGST
jgi:hypothetical protein